MTGASSSSSALSQAIDLFARLRANEPTPAARAELEAWLEASPEHQEAFDQVCDQWASMETLRGDTALMFMRESARRDVGHGKVRRAALGGLAAALAAAGVFAGFRAPALYQAFVERQAREHARTYASALGRVSKVRLADGTLATLDTDTVIRSWQVKDGRFVELVRGRARFQVVKNPARPFAVLAAGRSVTALGTDFDVYLRPNGVRVTLAEGRLRVKNLGRQTMPSVDMTAGYQLTATNGGGWALAQADAASNLSWTERQLTFDEAALRDIAAELNRYSRTKIVIRDPAVADLRMSAVIRNTDSRSFLDAVDELSLARVRETGGIYELTAR